jgi:acyl carrier protein
MTLLENDIKLFIIETLHLEDITVASIDNEAPLFNGDLGLDSIDSLELGVALKKKYNIKIDSNQAEELQHHFYSVKNLAAYIASQQEK